VSSFFRYPCVQFVCVEESEPELERSKAERIFDLIPELEVSTKRGTLSKEQFQKIAKGFDLSKDKRYKFIEFFPNLNY
jgi:hypothetical protein